MLTNPRARSLLATVALVGLAGCTGGSPKAVQTPTHSAALSPTGSPTPARTASAPGPLAPTTTSASPFAGLLHTTSGPTVITFGSSNPNAFDTAFVDALGKVSGGKLDATLQVYDTENLLVDVQVANDVATGAIQLGDTGSRAWPSLGADGFEAFQQPFLITSWPMLVRAVSPAITKLPLSLLDEVGVVGLAVVPIGVRYVFSSRPLESPTDFAGTTVRVNPSTTTSSIIAALGAKADDKTVGAKIVGEVKANQLVGAESDVSQALANNAIPTLPYIVRNAGLFAKVTTLVASSSWLRDQPAQVRTWLNEAAAQAVALAIKKGDSAATWAAACKAGLKPVEADVQQLAQLKAAEAGVTTTIDADPVAQKVTQQLQAIPQLPDARTTC